MIRYTQATDYWRQALEPEREVPDVGLVEYPSGLTLLLSLPNDVSQSLIDDEIFEGYAKTGKTYAEAIVDAHGRNEPDAVMRIISALKDAAGSTDDARACWDKFVEGL